MDSRERIRRAYDLTGPDRVPLEMRITMGTWHKYRDELKRIVERHSADGGQGATGSETGDYDVMPAGCSEGAEVTGLYLGGGGSDGHRCSQLGRRTRADGGLTWQEKGDMRAGPKGYPHGIFEESHVLQLRARRLLMISRVDHTLFPIPGRQISDEEYGVLNRLLAGYHHPPISSIFGSGFDQFMHLKIFFSDDDGATWQAVPTLGIMG